MAGKVTVRGEVMYPGEYLCAEDLKGKDVNLTIADVIKEELRLRDGGSEEKWILTFKETKRKLVLNKRSQPDAIAMAHGKKAEKWVGKRITLYPARVSAFGEMVDAIRIREKAPEPKAAAPPAEPDPAPESDPIGVLAGDAMASVVGLPPDAAQTAVVAWLGSNGFEPGDVADPAVLAACRKSLTAALADKTFDRFVP